MGKRPRTLGFQARCTPRKVGAIEIEHRDLRSAAVAILDDDCSGALGTVVNCSSRMNISSE
jgi:hypothetical protein